MAFLPALRVHSNQGNKVEGIQYMAYTSAQTFKNGELLIYDGSTGNVKIAGVDPTTGTIVGMALQDADSSPGFQMANSPATFTYRSQKISVVRPTDTTIFAGCLTNGSSTRATAAVADIGAQYGITSYNAGAAGAAVTVDKAKTGGSARVAVIGIDTDSNVIFFKFIASFLA